MEDYPLINMSLDGFTNAINMNLGKLWEMVGDRKAWHAAIHGAMKSQI